MATASLTDKLELSSRSCVAFDADLRGPVTVGASVIHPRASILALNGPIIIGDHCIIEEMVTIVNRRPETMRIGEYNMFESGCRVEAASVGDHNTFEPRSRTPSSVRISNWCRIGAACTVYPSASFERIETQPDEIETLPDRTVVFSGENRRRQWSGEGSGQAHALMVKHLDYLRETLPKFKKLKLVTR